MTQFLIAAVPLLVALVPLLRWPTLDRRMRAHLALLKELPDGVEAGPLRALVAREIAEVSQRDGRKLTREHRLTRDLAVGRVIHATISLLVLVPFAFYDPLVEWLEGLDPFLRWVVLLYGTVLLLLAQWWSSGRSMKRVERQIRAARASRKTRTAGG